MTLGPPTLQNPTTPRVVIGAFGPGSASTPIAVNRARLTVYAQTLSEPGCARVVIGVVSICVEARCWCPARLRFKKLSSVLTRMPCTGTPFGVMRPPVWCSKSPRFPVLV